jgi:hypothetical protein
MIFVVTSGWVRAEAVAVAVAALFAVSSAAVANADNNCGGFGPGILGTDNCGPADNNDNGRSSSQSGDSSWPPGLDYDSGGGSSSDSPIVPAESGP